MVRKAVMPGLVPGIRRSKPTGASGWIDRGDKYRDDTCAMWRGGASSQLLDLRRPCGPALLDEGADAFPCLAVDRGGEHLRGLIEHRPQRLSQGLPRQT